ncbi:MAG TPA: hypothetical protein VLK84_05975 [Longimicrobium sp.]|nr:hypothetical protein [Longimicrobium sp.]
MDFDNGLAGQLQIDSQAVLNDKGSVEVDVPEGKYTVQWFLVGEPKLKYSVTVEADGDEIFAYKGKMTSDGKTSGFKKFEVDE